MTLWLPRRAREAKLQALLAQTPVEERPKVAPPVRRRPVERGSELLVAEKAKRRQRNKVARSSRKANR